FPGIAILGNPAEQAAATIAPGGGTGISLYYHYEGDTVSKAYPINTIQSRYFNHIKSDRSGTPTEVISEPGLPYELAGNLVGSKASLGLVLRLDTQPIEDFLDTLDNVTFNQFVLEMGPLENFPDNKQPPKNLIMYFAGSDNGFMERADGRRVAVQAEKEIQVEGIDETGKAIPAVDRPNSLIFNGEKFN